MNDEATVRARLRQIVADLRNETLRRALDAEPLLNDFGYGVFDGHRMSKQQKSAKIAADRAAMFEPRSLEQFEAVRAWLRQFPKIKQVNRRVTSYGLKHVAEHDIGYVTNGVFIAAAIAEGFQVERAGGSPNAWLAISAKAWERGTRRGGDNAWWNMRRKAWCDDAGNVVERR
jgi:hypothetical protein